MHIKSDDRFRNYKIDYSLNDAAPTLRERLSLNDDQGAAAAAGGGAPASEDLTPRYNHFQTHHHCRRCPVAPAAAVIASERFGRAIELNGVVYTVKLSHTDIQSLREALDAREEELLRERLGAELDERRARVRQATRRAAREREAVVVQGFYLRLELDREEMEEQLDLQMAALRELLRRG
ncbi:MAG: hypothetical protein M1835_000620 [Candelina submexicana]|nr:MAG: hypothetical protein M1835_000620 [Candelina submexicana]